MLFVNGITHGSEVEIWNILGELVLKDQCNEQILELNTSNLGTGFYYLVIREDIENKMTALPIVKE